MHWLRTLVEGVRWIAYLIFWLGLAVGTYVRWKHLSEPGWLVATLLITSSSIVVCILSSIRQDSRLFRVSRLALSFNPSFLLGILSFSQTKLIKDDYYEMAMNVLLLASLVVYFSWAVTRRSLVSSYSPVIIGTHEVFALAGMAAAIFLNGHKHTFGMLCSVVFIGLTIFSFHRKNTLVVITIPLYILLNMLTILRGPPGDINKESLAVFFLILVSESLVNVYSSFLTNLDTWKPVFETRLCVIRLFSVLMICMEALLLLLVGISLNNHKEWWAVIPIFIACSLLLWLPSHFVYFVANWKLWSRVLKAIEIFKSDTSRNLPHILSSRGLRHFALYTYPLMWGNVVVTLVLFLWSWTTQTDQTAGLLLICLPLQIIIIGLLRDLSYKLGGTCCGYALVTPAVLRSEDEDNLREVQTSSSYATRTIRLIQEFFNHHLIADGGCEYLSDRLTEPALEAKLKEFFNMKTKQSDNYDSYLLYYSGPVNQSGDWMLKGGGIFSYSKLINMWMNHEVCDTSRLLLLLDTARSNYWVPQVRRTTTAYVGIQTIYVSREAEKMQEFCIGDFTRDWVDFNCNKDSEVYADHFRTPIIVTYGISTYWSNFRFHEPSVEEMDRHWQENFSIHGMKPVIKLCSLFDRKHVCCLCTFVSRCLSLLRMWMWTPNQLDIGHGFKLLRFFKIPGDATIV